MINLPADFSTNDNIVMPVTRHDREEELPDQYFSPPWWELGAYRLGEHPVCQTYGTIEVYGYTEVHCVEVE